MASFHLATDLLTAIYNGIKSKIFLGVYPVGSIYLSLNSTNPSTYFGGTWEAISGRFLLGANSTYKAGTTGGEATHKLTISEMPAHTHNAWQKNTSQLQTSEANALPTSTVWTKNLWNVDNFAKSTGGNQAHNNMPPYLSVYMWKRTK